MAQKDLERAIAMAVTDISDAMSDGSPGMRTEAMHDFMEMVLWSAASVAETLSATSWVNPKKDDQWTKQADSERYSLPESMSDKQFRDLTELLSLGQDSLEKSIPSRIKMQPELEGKIKDILGIRPEPLLDPGPESAAPEMVPTPAPKRRQQMKISKQYR